MLARGSALASRYCANQGMRSAAMTLHSLEVRAPEHGRHPGATVLHTWSTQHDIRQRELDLICGASGMHDC